MRKRTADFATTLPLVLLTILQVMPAAAADPGLASAASEAAKAELKRQISSAAIVGGTHLAVRDGKTVHSVVEGVCDVEDGRPLRADTIMRIYSMTKPITSTGAIILWERGRFQLDDPVSKYLPAFAETKVLVESDGKSETVPLDRPITVRDLFRHTVGYSYGRGAKPAIFQHHERLGVVYDAQHGMFPPKMSIADAADALAQIPLLHQPGARFTYGFNTDVLGRLIEVWSRQKLDRFLHDEVFFPLEMGDTAFATGVDKVGRLATCHTPKDGKQVVADKAKDSPFVTGFPFLSGGGGLVSTMGDYANFCEMLINGGTFHGKRLLNRSTLDLMFTDQLDEVAGSFQFGLGFAIQTVDVAGDFGEPKKVTSYYWGGYANTAFEVIPELGFYQIFMRQSVPSNGRVSAVLFPLIRAGLEHNE